MVTILSFNIHNVSVLYVDPASEEINGQPALTTSPQ